MRSKLFSPFAAVIILAALFITGPVMAAVSPILTEGSGTEHGKTSMFSSGKLSAISDYQSSTIKSKAISRFPASQKPDLAAFKAIPADWDPWFMYAMDRYSHRIPRCNIG